MNGKLWIISFDIDGEEVVNLFNQETADKARRQAMETKKKQPKEAEVRKPPATKGGATTRGFLPPDHPIFSSGHFITPWPRTKRTGSPTVGEREERSEPADERRQPDE